MRHGSASCLQAGRKPGEEARARRGVDAKASAIEVMAPAQTIGLDMPDRARVEAEFSGFMASLLGSVKFGATRV